MKAGIEAGTAAGVLAGAEKAERDGRLPATGAGHRRAKWDGDRGWLWPVYVPPGLWAVVCGFAGGLIARYIGRRELRRKSADLLARDPVNLNGSDVLPEWLSVVVPGLKRNRDYVSLSECIERRRAAQAKIDKSRCDLETRKAEITNLGELSNVAVAHAGNLDDLRITQLCESYSKQAQELLAALEKAAGHTRQNSSNYVN